LVFLLGLVLNDLLSLLHDLALVGDQLLHFLLVFLVQTALGLVQQGAQYLSVMNRILQSRLADINVLTIFLSNEDIVLRIDSPITPTLIGIVIVQQ
jgi:hypothetical protein